MPTSSTALKFEDFILQINILESVLNRLPFLLPNFIFPSRYIYIFGTEAASLTPIVYAWKSDMALRRPSTVITACLAHIYRISSNLQMSSASIVKFHLPGVLSKAL